MNTKRLHLKRSMDIGDTTIVTNVWSGAVRELPARDAVWDGALLRSISAPVDDTGVSARTKRQLLDVWAVNMLPLSYGFPGYVSALASRADSDIVRHKLIANAWDESGGYKHYSRSHFWLAIRFARMLGLSDQEIENVRPLPAAEEYLSSHYEACTSGDFAHALGMICMIEEWAESLYSVFLKAFLQSRRNDSETASFVSEGGAAYFNGNMSDDAQHRREMHVLLGAWLATQDVALDDRECIRGALAPVIAGAQRNTQLRAGLYQAIHDYVAAGGTIDSLLGRR